MGTSTRSFPASEAIAEPGLSLAGAIRSIIILVEQYGGITPVRIRLSVRAAATIIASMHMPTVDGISALWGLPVVTDEDLEDGDWRVEVGPLDA